MTNSAYRLAVDPTYGFLRVDPTPSVEEVEQYYLNEFYSGEYRQFNDSQLQVQQEQKDFFRLQWQLIHDQCEKFIGPLAGRTLLDIGCGYCQALLYFRERGLQVHGLEPSKEGADYAAAHDIPCVRSGIETMPADLGRRFDVVTLLNVLEHLREPARALIEIRERYLAPAACWRSTCRTSSTIFRPRQMSCMTSANGGSTLRAPELLFAVIAQAAVGAVRLSRGRRRSVLPARDVPALERRLRRQWRARRACHTKRVAFELNLVKHGKLEKLKQFYAALADLELGRQVTIYATPAAGKNSSADRKAQHRVGLTRLS